MIIIVSFYMFRSCFVVQNFCLFSATFAMLRSIFLHRPGHPADVPTSGDFLCCQINRYLFHPSPCDLLSLRWLHQQTTGLLGPLDFSNINNESISVLQGCYLCFKKVFFHITGKTQKKSLLHAF